MKINILAFIAVLFYTTLFSQPQPIQVTILNSQPVTGITSIQYEFSGPFSTYDISVEVSFDGDSYQTVPEADLSGDLNNVAPGVRNIVWNGAASFSNYYHEQTRIRITAAPNIICGDQITDIDGNIYNTVLIGTQCWMKENLNSTRDADGNSITRYCFDNNPINCNVYGGLYTWPTIMNGASSSDNVPSGVRGICPDGWHVPSNAEWTALTNFVGSQPGFLCNANSIYIAKALSAKTNWHSSTDICAIGNDLSANNATGFSLLPGGNRDDDGDFSDIGLYGYWWTATESNLELAWIRNLDYHDPFVGPYPTNKALYGFSVRCLRD